jgi:UDP-glucose 4-epimerase
VSGAAGDRPRALDPKAKTGLRVVVVGATGNIGAATVTAMSQDERVGTVVGVARRSPSWRPTHVDWYPADITRADLGLAFAGADAVVHLAWQIQPSHDVWTQWHANVAGSARVIDAVIEAGVRRFVCVTSVGAYSPAPRDGRLRDERHPTWGMPSLPYSWQKAHQERLCDVLAAQAP